MGAASYSTQGVPEMERARRWTSAIAETYFPLHLTFSDPASFRGHLERRPIGDLSLSRLRTEPVRFERRQQHITGAQSEEYLVSIPQRSPVEFRQMGRDVRCDPGGFIIERGDEPYRFSYSAQNDLCVLKVPKPLLAERVRAPDRFCARVFDGRSGAGGLFVTMARSLQEQQNSEQTERVVSRHLIELLALALNDAAEDEGGGSAVRAAHLSRAEAVIRENLRNPDLTPDAVAERCGISKRYLHELFADTNSTVSQRIRDERLCAARDLLEAPSELQLSEVAYRFGFSDQAQFSRLFRAKFGETPSGFRANSLKRE